MIIGFFRMDVGENVLFGGVTKQGGDGGDIVDGLVGVQEAGQVEFFLEVHTVEAENEEGVEINFAGDEIEDGGQVFAGDGPVGATAMHGKVAPGIRKEGHARVPAERFEVRGHLTGKEGGQQVWAGGDGLYEGFFLVLAETSDADRDLVGSLAAPADAGFDEMFFNIEAGHHAIAGVGASSGEPVGIINAGESTEPGLAPPGGAIGCTADG